MRERSKAADRRQARAFAGAVLSFVAMGALFVDSLLGALAAAAW